MKTPIPWAYPTRPAERSQLLSAGVTPAMLKTALRAGGLRALRHGVYFAAAEWPDDPVAQHLLLAHAEQVVNPAAVISHQSAALAWRLPNPSTTRWSELPVSVTLPAGRHSSRAGTAIHHVGRLASEIMFQPWVVVERVARALGVSYRL